MAPDDGVAETPASASSRDTPEAASDSAHHSAQKLAAVKDRQCKFCHQTFTSSSLGRHLDTFIREKNPKAPDGVHDVEEIKRIRSNITRRHARNSSATHHPTRRTSSSPPQSIQQQSNEPPTLQPLQAPIHPPSLPPSQAQPTAPGFRSERSQSFYYPHKADWTATGVINDLPPTRFSDPRSLRELPPPQPDASRYVGIQSYQEKENLESGRAAELALKEVLTAIREATNSAKRSHLYDFDFFSSNFPTLCLRMLPAPSTIHGTTPMTSDESWPIEPPEEETLRKIQKSLSKRIEDFRRSGMGSVSREGVVLAEDFQRYYSHLNAQYGHWTLMSEIKKKEIWMIEIMKALARASTREASLQQEVQQLRSQLERGRQQQKSGGSYSIPSIYDEPSQALQLDQDVVLELSKCRSNLDQWEYDKLINKWKRAVQSRPPASELWSRQASTTGSQQFFQYHPPAQSTAPQLYAQTTPSQPAGADATSVRASHPSYARMYPQSPNTSTSAAMPGSRATPTSNPTSASDPASASGSRSASAPSADGRPSKKRHFEATDSSRSYDSDVEMNEGGPG